MRNLSECNWARRSGVWSFFLVIFLIGGNLKAQDSLVPYFSEEIQRFGYISTEDSSRFVIQPKFERAFPFQSGIARVKSEDGYRLINRKGKKLTKNPYKYIGWSDDFEGQTFLYQNKYIAYQEGGQWGIINYKGKIILKPNYTSLNHFIHDVAVVSTWDNTQEKQLYGAMNLEGKAIIPLQFDGMTPLLSNPYFLEVELGNKRGIYNAEGKEIIPVQFSQIKLLENGWLVAKDTSNQLFVYSKEGKSQNKQGFHNVQVADSLGYMFTERFGRKGLLSPMAEELYAPVYKTIQPTDSSYIADPYHSITVISPKGKELFNLSYDSIQNIGENLYLYQIDGKKGIVTNQGEVLSYGEYDKVSSFVEGLSIVVKNGLYGVINQQMQEVIPIKYNNIEREQQAYFRVTNGHVDIFDKLGKNITQDKYVNIDKLSANRYLVKVGKYYGYLNERFEEVIDVAFEDAEAFVGKYAVVRKGDYYGVIDQEGKWIIQPVVDRLQSISEGLFLYHDNEAWGTLNTDGIEVFRSDEVELEVRNGTVLSRYKGKYGLINDRGEVCLPAIYDSVSSVRDDQTVFMHKGGERYFKHLYDKGIPQKGAYSHNEWIGEQTEGFAPVRMNGQYGFVDFLGRLRISPRYQEVKSYQEGLAPMKLGGKWGYIDKEDRIFLQPFYEEAGLFDKGLAIVKQDGKYGVINRRGQFILTCKFDQISVLPTGNWLICERKNKMGVYTRNGMKGIYGKYNQVEDLGNGMVITMLDGKYGLDRIDGFSVRLPKYDKVKYNHFDNTYSLFIKEATKEISTIK